MSNNLQAQVLATEIRRYIATILRYRGYTSFSQIPNYGDCCLDTLLAHNIAAQAHMGAVDKAGTAYINHPIAVANLFTCTYRKSIGFLHDVAEDTDITLETLKQKGIDIEVIKAVACITHGSGSYTEYLNQVMRNPLAVDVKMADIWHNSDITRLSVIDQRAIVRLQKYHNGIKYLADKYFDIREEDLSEI